MIPTFLFLEFRLFSFPLLLIFLFLGILQLSPLSWLFRFLVRLLLLLIFGGFLLWLLSRLPSTSWLHLFTQFDHLFPQHLHLIGK